jgi:putative phosphoesterase
MRVALIGDVHANLPALEAVLADAKRRRAEAIWNAGDFVGYGAFPDEVVGLLRQVETASIIGNYDLKVLKFQRKRVKWKKRERHEKWLAFKWAHENLSEASRDYLASLPRERRLEAEGWRFLLVHGSPVSDDEHLRPQTPEARLGELARMADADVVVCGHSHQPMVRKVEGVRFINTGSVGRPDDGDPRACYVTLEVTRERLRARHHRVAYDLARAVAAVRECGLPDVFAQILIEGRSLDSVLPAAEPPSRPATR